MKSLFESIIDSHYNKLLIEEYKNEVSESVINEAFQSELLTNLATEIKKVESRNRESDKKQAEYYKQYGYSYGSSKTAKSFTSIFGPITQTKYSKQEKFQGIKWSEIKDSDFKKYDVEKDNKEVRKVLKEVYRKKSNADCIICEPGSKVPVMFIKGYGHELHNPIVYFFNYIYDKEGNKKPSGVKAMTRPKYSYKERDLNFEEMMDAIDGMDIYILTITQDMIKTYSELSDNRMEGQKGVIEYDAESLTRLLNAQKRRYKVLADEMRAKKLQDKSKNLFDDIKKANDRVVELYQKVMSNPENMDKYFDLGNLIQYVGYSYESFYKSMKAELKAKKTIEKARKEGYDNPEKWAEFDIANSQEYIRDADKYLKQVNKDIDNIEKELK